LTYNVLHTLGAKRLLRGKTIAPWSQDRLLRVAQLVQQLNPDIACLQEVDEAGQSALVRALDDDFECVGFMRNELLPPKDGCATFVRKSSFEVLEKHEFRIRDVMKHHLTEQFDSRHRATGLAAAFWRELQEKLNLSIALRLKCVRQGSSTAQASIASELCIATTHLYWDPKYPDLKLVQAYLLAKELDKFSGSTPLILAGDLNSTPSTDHRSSSVSGVYKLLTQGKVEVTHPHHPVSLRRSSGILRGVSSTDVPELSVAPFQSAYLEALGFEGPITNSSADFTGCLDYILYRSGAPQPMLKLVKVRKLPSEAELAEHMPLPSSVHPSDHLPLLAEFELSGGSNGGHYNQDAPSM